MKRLLSICLLFSLAACAEKPADVPAAGSHQKLSRRAEAPPQVTAPADFMTLARRYEHEETFRRAILEQSLVNHQNGYAQARLTHYTPEDWGQLPLPSYKWRPVRPEDLGKVPPVPDHTWTSIDEKAFAADQKGIEQLGARMFNSFPAQVERSMFPVLRKEGGPAEYGLWQTEESVGGLVWVSLPGGVFPALTCSTCHAAVDKEGTLRMGLPNHQFNLGKAKDDYTGAHTLYSTWGPGRVDIAADGKDNPIVIADVRAVRFQTHLHRTANIQNSLAALAFRVETGLIAAHRQALRPSPKSAFALASYLWKLGLSLPSPPSDTHPGHPVFHTHCASCHEGEGFSGAPVSAESIDSPVAKMPSPARGTGKLQVPSLRGVSNRRLLLYGGHANGIKELLHPKRREGGHHMGRSLTPEERENLLKYLESL